jgi:predicted DNA-binding transcriptional regulator YafY
VPAPEGWQTVELQMESEDMAARQLLLLGAEAEVLQPAGLRNALRALARGVLARYGERPAVSR